MARPGACPSCGRPVGRRDAICIGCGWNLRSGERTNTAVRPDLVRGGLRDGAVAAAIVVIGTLAELAFFEAARGDPTLSRAFRLTVGAGLILVVGTLALHGFREDGLLGIWYRLEHPLGTILGGDDRPPWTWLAIGWLVLMGGALVGLLGLK